MQGSAISMQQLLHELLVMALKAQHAQLSVWQQSSTAAQNRSAAEAGGSSPDYQQLSLANSADGMICVVKGVVDLPHNHTKLANPEAVLLGTLCNQQFAPEHIRLAADSLQEHAVRLCSGVEYYVRAQAATAKPPAVGGSLGQRLYNARKGRQVFEGVNPVNEFAMLELLLLAVHEGPGGKTQQHLLSLLFSMLKSCAAQGVSVRHALHGRFAAFYCAVEVLSGMQRQGETSRAKHGIVEAALPWLALCGRCCLQWARDLQQPPKASGRSGSSSTDTIGQVGRTDFVLDRLRIGCTADLFFEDPEHGVMFASTSISLMKCLGWLQAVNTDAQTRAAGHDLGPALEALEGAVELTSNAPKKTDAAGAALGVLRDTIAPKLDALGLALGSLPYRDVCNNPGCRDMSGESDFLLVKGRKQCSGCHYARYCCKDCSKQHWPQHRAVCKALAAAKAGGGE